MNLLRVVTGSLRREKEYLLTLVVTLGVCAALGGTALAVNVILLFQDLPYPGADDLYELRIFLERAEGEVSGATPPMAPVVRSSVPSVLGVGSAVSTSLRIKTVDQDVQVRGGLVSESYLNLLAPGLAAGEGLDSLTSQGRDLETSAVISGRLQRMLFDSPQGAVGQLLTVEGTVVEVVGVLDDAYRAPRELMGQPEDIWIGMRVAPDDPKQWARLSSNTQILVKVASPQQKGQVEEQAGAVILDQLRLHNAALLDESQAVSVRLVALRDAIVGDSEKVGLTLLAAAIALLGLGLSFAAFLVLARIGRLRSALRLHLVLGARRQHLLRWAGIEVGGVLLLTTGVGWIVGTLALRSVQSLGHDLLARVAELHFGIHFALVVFLVALLAVAILAIPLARLLSRHETLLTGSGGFKGVISSPNLAWRRSLLGAQAALTAAGLAIGIVAAMDTVPRLLVPAEFRSQGRDFIQVQLPGHLRGAEAKDDLLPRLQNALRGAGFGGASPVDMPLLSTALALYGLENIATGTITPSQINGTDHELFSALEMPVLAGRTFSAEEFRDRAAVMVIGSTLAQSLGGVDQAVGQGLRSEERAFEVIGVVADVRNPILEIPGVENQAYIPFTNYDGVPTLSFVTRLPEGGRKPESSAVVSALREVDEQLFLGAYRPLSQFRDELLADTRLKAILAVVFVLAILLLTIVCVRTLIADTYRELSPLLASHWAVGAKYRNLRALLLQRILLPTFVGVAIFVALGLITIYRFDLIAEAVRTQALLGLLGAGVAMLTLIASIARLSSRTHLRSIFQSISNINAANGGVAEVSVR